MSMWSRSVCLHVVPFVARASGESGGQCLTMTSKSRHVNNGDGKSRNRNPARIASYSTSNGCSSIRSRSP